MAPVEPKPAAVCVILNERGEVLLGRRSLELRFMPGRHVFPGGRIDENESDDHVLDYASHAEAIAVKAAAREAFEESGLLLLKSRQVASPSNVA